MGLDRLFDGDYLFNGGPGPASIGWGIVGVVYLALLVVGILVYVYHDSLFPEQKLKATLARTAAIAGIVLGAVGVVLIAARYLQIPVISARVLVFLLILATLVLAGYAVYYIRARYQSRLSRHQSEELRRRYLPRPKAKPGAPPSRLTRERRKAKKRH